MQCIQFATVLNLLGKSVCMFVWECFAMHMAYSIDSNIFLPHTDTLLLAPYQFHVMVVRCNKKTKTNSPGKTMGKYNRKKLNRLWGHKYSYDIFVVLMFAAALSHRIFSCSVFQFQWFSNRNWFSLNIFFSFLAFLLNDFDHVRMYVCTCSVHLMYKYIFIAYHVCDIEYVCF